MSSSTVQQDMRRSIAPVRRRLAGQEMFLWTLRGGIVGGLLAAGVLLGARVIAWPEAHMIALGLAVTAVIAGGVVGVWRRPSVLTSIRLTDRRLHLHDRLLTAWEYAGTVGSLATLQREETETALRGMTMRRAAPWSLPRRETPALLGAGAVLAVVLWLPNPMDAQLRQQALEQAHLRAAAAAIHHILPAVPRATNPAQTHAQASDARLRAQIAQLLSALQAKLRQSTSTAEALRAVSRTQQELAALAPPHSADAAAALSSVESALANAGQAGAQKTSRSTNASATAANTLRSLSQSAATMTAARQAALAKALARAANGASSTPKLGGSLQQAAAALGRNDSAGAKTALTSAAKAAQAANSAAQAAEEIAATNRALDALKNQIATTPSSNARPAGQPDRQIAQGQPSSASQNPAQSGSSSQQQAQSAGQASTQDQSAPQDQGATTGEQSQGASSQNSQSQSGSASTGQGQQSQGQPGSTGTGQARSGGAATAQGQKQSQSGSPSTGQGQSQSSTGSSSQGSTASAPANGGQGQGSTAGTQGQGQGTAASTPGGSGQGTGQGGSSGAGQGQGKSGDRVFVPGSVGQGPRTTTQGPTSQPSSGQSLPYQQVLASYARSARSSLERQSLPPTLQTEVGRYFATLNK